VPGGVPAQKRNAPLAVGGSAGDVHDSRVTPDGGTVVYLADSAVFGQSTLHAVPAVGGAVVDLVGPMVTGGSVAWNQSWIVTAPDWDLTADGTRAVYLADAAVDDQFELYSVPVAGSAPPVKLSQPLPLALSDVRGFELTSDGARVVYIAFRNSGIADLFVTRTDGTGVPRQLNLSGQNVAVEQGT